MTRKEIRKEADNFAAKLEEGEDLNFTNEIEAFAIRIHNAAVAEAANTAIKSEECGAGYVAEEIRKKCLFVEKGEEK